TAGLEGRVRGELNGRLCVGPPLHVSRAKHATTQRTIEGPRRGKGEAGSATTRATNYADDRGALSLPYLNPLAENWLRTKALPPPSPLIPAEMPIPTRNHPSAKICEICGSIRRAVASMPVAAPLHRCVNPSGTGLTQRTPRRKERQRNRGGERG